MFLQCVQNFGNFFLLKSGCNVPKHFHIFKKKDTGSLAHIFQIIDAYLEEYQEPEEVDFRPLTCYTALYCPSLESTRLSLLVPRIALKRMTSVIPFSSCPQFLPASGSFLMSQLFAWGGQSIGVSALASVLPKNTQD